MTISIHALLAESDTAISFLPSLSQIFLSTLSLRRATPFSRSDPMTRRYFYPRSPCGERPYGRINDISRLIFLSTLSLRRATLFWASRTRWELGFLSTLSLRRATPLQLKPPIKSHNFYPRSPCGERLINTYHRIFGGGISIHALLAESDRRGAVSVILII